MGLISRGLIFKGDYRDEIRVKKGAGLIINEYISATCVPMLSRVIRCEQVCEIIFEKTISNYLTKTIPSYRKLSLSVN